MNKVAATLTWAWLCAAPCAAAVRFVEGPQVSIVHKAYRVRFAVSEQTDVTVCVLDRGGQVVRHLAAGVLGAHAPEPLQKNSLAQSILWDGRDDAGRRVVDRAGGGLAVRVQLGLRPRFDVAPALACHPELRRRISFLTNEGRGCDHPQVSS